ncbi:MAG: glycosyl hydrolase [Cytophagaceae bacterium]|nr:glycosyl hydrolase [Cytophagaceae bacterium]|tara:strand:- start:5360 stop:6997 length:1638 start_codon:yes stop_codon:yes gene_type:complete
MKNIKIYFKILVAAFAIMVQACQEDDQQFGDITAPSNLVITANVIGADEQNPNGDGSGKVEFTATADNASNFKFTYGDNASTLASDGSVTHTFTNPGTNEYVVTVIASGTAGAATSKTMAITVYSEFNDPETKSLLTGDASKTWYVAAALPGHLGVGPVEGFDPSYYAAAPFEKESVGCFYNDAITFSLNGDGNIIYNLDNQGATFFNVDFLSVAGGGGGEDQCLAYDTSGDKFVNLASAQNGVPENFTTGTQMIIGDGGFMSYYIGTSNYEILELTDDYMYVRAIPGSNPALAWYLKFTTDPDGGGNSVSPDILETQYSTLAWSDEFDAASLDTSLWNYEIGNNGGWGNGEKQYYTDSNTSIVDGVLHITAKKEPTNGFDYSSARITTQDNYEFTYGRVEVRAKLAGGGGTWPAIWMLGANFDEVGWPTTGEIDIMEYVGNNPGHTSSALHLPGNSGGNAIFNDTEVENETTEFHNYTVEWREDEIILAVDDVVHLRYSNTADTPFNKPFFLILNVAMGGTLGGDIDPNFTESTMEIDYVKVYQ